MYLTISLPPLPSLIPYMYTLKYSYEPLDEDYDSRYSFIRIFNQGEKFLVNRVQGKHNFIGCYVIYHLLTLKPVPTTFNTMKY